ncbi:hypothetical protein A7E78_00795 [Syntrophotalea acetylenivorans]|uniref:Uncharacterized protein n=1 Tax=Syntrophotalea acetylenivorans TaxID=1842532 RepID=A0A1L3GKR7_9BACT|nr:efflux RND transporter periplasmic adaptor subunit [Syntrophotalea acetylenivorans]APG26526.1 hypothetical protein A7E78_00795 [Syntrophotalea acetylenivorans]
MKFQCLFIVMILLAVNSLTGCSKEEQVIEEIRSVKTFTVQELSTGQVRKFSGIVQAAESSALSFEVGGQVEQVLVDIGDRVQKEQILAVLDKEPYELLLKSAEAELVRARANLTNKKADYEREEAIFKEGAGSQKRLDQAKFGYREAGAGVRVATSKLNLALRDLRKTTLFSPYDGSIGKRMIEPHMEVAAGQRLFEIDAEGDMEVEVNIPETVVNQITIGSETAIVLTVQPDQKIAGTVSSIGTMAETANAFPVKVSLPEPPADIQSGMTAEVTFPLQKKNGQPGYLLPPQAFQVGKESGSAYVFIYDAASSTVKKTPIRMSGAKNNQAVVVDGLAAGDIVVVAGLGFLSDGMQVRLMEQPAPVKPEAFDLK